MEYSVYQLKRENLDKYGFMDYGYASEHGFDLSDYEKTYEGVIIPNGDGVEATLEDIFVELNVNHPKDYHCHSLSVSDIVEYDGAKWYVDSFGFKRISQ